MMAWEIALLGAVYLLHVLAVTGWLFANIKGNRLLHDKRDDLGLCVLFALVLSLGGPLGFLVALCVTGFARHGWCLR